MQPPKTLTDEITSGDKSVRGIICYPFTQWIWYAVLPVRWGISRIFGLVLGKNAERFLWRKILTPANFLTAARFWLLAESMKLFIAGAPLSPQVTMLFFAIITDFFDGPLARNNDEVTELGTYLDHIGDWGVILWAFLLNFWYDVMSTLILGIIFAVIPILFLINCAKFKKFYDPENSWIVNISGFAVEELQTDVWGRLQFVFLAVALFGGLFFEASRDSLFLFRAGLHEIPSSMQRLIREGSLALYFILAGYAIRDALDYSETQAKRFREKIRQLKSGS